MSLPIHERQVRSKVSLYGRKMRRKRLRRTIITIIILVALLFGLGFVYTWYVGRQPLDDKANQPAPQPVVQKRPTVREVNENAQVGIVQQTLTTPIKPPANIEFSVKTNNGAACQIRVTYDKTESKDSGLVPKIADDFGVVVWTWSVPLGTPVGKWPLDVTCANQTHSAYYRGELEVTD